MTDYQISNDGKKIVEVAFSRWREFLYAGVDIFLEEFRMKSSENNS